MAIEYSSPGTIKVMTGTGDYAELAMNYEQGSTKTVLPGGYQATEVVLSGMRETADLLGLDFGMLCVLAAKMSGFNSMSNDETFKRSGLMMIRRTDWEDMVYKYGYAQKIGYEEIWEPRANCIMAGHLILENKTTMRQIGIALYSNLTYMMCYILGVDNARKLLAAKIQYPNEFSYRFVNKQLVQEQRPYFYDNSGNPLTTVQTYEIFVKYESLVSQFAPFKQYSY